MTRVCSVNAIGNGCSKLTYCNFTEVANAHAPPSDAGSCAPSGGGVRPFSWDRGAAGCAFAAPPASACSEGQACAPDAPDARICVHAAGELPCPPGPYGEQHVYYASAHDDRTCAACTCGPPTSVACSGGAVQLYVDPNCTKAGQVVNVDAPCKTVGANQPNGSAMITAPPALVDGGACAPSGGEQDGGVLPTGPVTVCCAP